MRRDPQQRTPLMAGFTNADDVRMLHVANAAVHHLEAVRGCLAAEILPFDHGHPHAAKNRVPCHTGTEDTAADDDEVEFLTFQVFNLAFHWDDGPVDSVMAGKDPILRSIGWRPTAGAVASPQSRITPACRHERRSSW